MCTLFFLTLRAKNDSPSPSHSGKWLRSQCSHVLISELGWSKSFSRNPLFLLCIHPFSIHISAYAIARKRSLISTQSWNPGPVQFQSRSHYKWHVDGSHCFWISIGHSTNNENFSTDDICMYRVYFIGFFQHWHHCLGNPRYCLTKSILESTKELEWP